MGLPRLLAELTDRIIDFCYDDKWTLSNCALANSSWLPASRLHLFYTIISSGEKGTDRAVQLTSIIGDKTIAVLQRWPSILPYIKIVKIVSQCPDQLENAASLAHAIRTFCDSEGLPSPSVHISLIQFKTGPKILSTQLSLINDIVTHVKLHNVTFVYADEIWPFLSSLPRLQHLEIPGFRFSTPTRYSLPPERMFDGIPLSTLRVSTMFQGIVILSLTNVAGSMSHLEDFGIVYEGVWQKDLPQLAEAIQKMVKMSEVFRELLSGCRKGQRIAASRIRYQ